MVYPADPRVPQYDEPDEGAGAQAWTSYQDKLLKTLESVLCLYESASGELPVPMS